MDKEDNDELKEMARLARNRMKNGFWTRVKAQRSASLECDNTNYASYIKRELEREKKTDEREAEFYRRVEELVTCSEEIVNPIGRLIDRDYYESLDYNARQRYILELSERYRQVAATIVTKNPR